MRRGRVKELKSGESTNTIFNIGMPAKEAERERRGTKWYILNSYIIKAYQV